MANELGVHQPLHIQVIFVNLFIVSSSRRSPRLSRLHTFLLRGDQHVSLGYLLRWGHSSAAALEVQVVTDVVSGSSHPRAIVLVRFVEATDGRAFFSDIASASLRRVNRTLDGLVVVGSIVAFGIEWRANTSIIVLDVLTGGALVHNLLILFILELVYHRLLAISGVEVESLGEHWLIVSARIRR